jgi:hypothetical protein
MSNTDTQQPYIGYYNGENIASFISYQGKRLEVNKLVDQIWFTGSLSANDTPQLPRLHLNILLADGNRKEFVSSTGNASELLDEADKYIGELLKSPK